ncbi:enoyl-CoA hydratase/isomerase family protein [Corynebacterium aquatimens]|uniref:Enoyl-CoA hydratase/carnithine racemase n=1 Tax=Corynebacterium aquatimens TaxID=1190508 RepID=A0A931GRN9_9CORY|nr:enoyl-CoA hydratase-related protein [Corynebacterium aquatimens]MBG6122188.1 enoyl-CoA hydratase/carnithine racemase [Corynebacterium aquatimens]WJY65271.1 1,2-epoxyphenylacetyl-CoA isomerase [Corynebacterium aquatimens]
MDTSSSSPIITAEVDGTIATIRISNPEKRNALRADSYRAIGELVLRAGNDASIRAVIITGDDTAFCAGMDVESFANAEEFNVAPHGVAPALVDIEMMADAITRCPIPVIAAVEGACAGIGASVAFATDIIIASEEAFVVLPFGRIGLMPDGGAVATAAASMGRHRAMALVLAQLPLSAKEALAAGLVAKLSPKGQALATAQELARSFSTSPRGALAATKAAVNKAALRGFNESLAFEAQTQTALLGTEEHQQGVAAFLNKRTHQFD